MYLDPERRPNSRILGHVLPDRQIPLLSPISRSQPFIQGGPHRGPQNPNPGIITVHHPIPILPSDQPTRHRRVHRKHLRQRHPERIQIEGRGRVVSVVKYHVDGVKTHRVVQARKLVGHTRPDWLAGHHSQPGVHGDPTHSQKPKIEKNEREERKRAEWRLKGEFRGIYRVGNGNWM